MAKSKITPQDSALNSSSPIEITSSKYASSVLVNLPLTKAAQYVGGSASTIFTQPMFFSPLHTPQNWQIASKRKEVYQWARFYYENEPKAAAGIDFYSGFPMNGLTLECKDKKILTYYEHSIEKLNLEYWLRKISHEYFLLGDVFVFTEIACPVCNGIGHLSNGNLCNHPDGTIKRLLILNPDFIEVQSTQLADEPTVALIPDDDLKRVVQQKKPKAVYDRIPDNIKEYVVSGRPIPLSPRCISHLRHKGSPYGTYGESLLRRLFTVIAYKTKLMTANWIMAERHILPVRVAKVGNAERPASEIDIADVQGQLAAVSNDPNLTIVTHHAFELDFIGATGKIHDISNQMEMIGKEMLDGLMLPQTLLNGEMASYSCHDESTLTLTDSGFKVWDKITDQDKIACYNPDTKEIEYHNYIEKHIHDFSGEMVQFSTDKIDICVTPNHRMWSAKRDSDSFEFVEAKDVLSGASFIGAVDEVSSNPFNKMTIGEKEISQVSYNGKVYCFTVPHGIFVTMRNGKITVQGNSAAVGVETLIRRLETWRMELSTWVEKNVFLPIAQMQGFVDTQKSKLIGETVWLYPKIKWNDLRLRDNTQYLQSLTQLHDKGLISTQKLLSEFNIDFDQEINRLREEQITAGKGGQVTGGPPGGGMDLGLGGMGGGMGGGMDLGGGGMPPGLSAPPPGGGAPPDMGGGMPPGMPPAVAASEDDLTKVAQLMYPEQQATQPQVERVYKKGKEPKKKDTVVPEASTEKIFLTKPEQKLYSIIQSINVPFRLFAQYEQHVAGVQNAYLLDFAFPDIMLNLEADGDFWHSDYEAVERDKVRDMKLASIGWRVVRIKESALNNNADMATQIILTNIKEAISQRKALMSKKAMITEEEYAVSYEDGDEVKISHQNFVSEEDS